VPWEVEFTDQFGEPCTRPLVGQHQRRTGLMANLLYLSSVAKRERLDVLVCCQESVPLRSVAVRIAYLHDVIHRDHPEFFIRPERLYLAEETQR
jgi:hypothetical protein